MRVGLRNARLSAAVLVALYGASATHARDLIWDATGSSAPTGADGSGSWDTGASNWVDPTAGTNVTWSNANPDSATFGLGPTTPTAVGPASSVFLGTSITVRNVTFGTATNGGYYNVFDQGDGGQTLTLAGDIVKTSGAGTPQFQLANALVLAAGNHVVAINDTSGDLAELTMNNPITGSGSLTLDNGHNASGYAQYGTLLLNLDNSHTGGTAVNMGRLVITTAGALGNGPTTIGARGALALGGAGTAVGGLNVSAPITLTRNTYDGAGFDNYQAAIIATNDGGSATHTLSGPVVIDSTDARVKADTNRIVIASPLVAGGANVAAANAVFTADGDYAGFVQLAADNTAFGSAGGAIKVMGGVELEVSSEANLGGATSKLLLTGGTIRATGALGSGAFMTNFGAHDLGGAAVNTGVNTDPGQTFTVDNLTGVAVGKRGTGTMNFNGTNTFSGVPYFDAGTVNVNGSTTVGAFRLRSPVFNINDGATVTTTGPHTNVGSDGPDDGTLNLNGSGTLIGSGADFNVSDNAGSRGTVNVKDTSTLTVDGLFLGKASDTAGTVNQSGGTVTTRRGGGFSLVLGQGKGATGAYVKTGGTLNVVGEAWIGNGGDVPDDRRGGGSGSFSQTAGDTSIGNWFVVGRAGAQGTFDVSGGTVTKGGGGNSFVGESNNAVTSTMTLRGASATTINTGEFWVGQDGGRGVLTIKDTASLTVNNWLAVARANGNSVGTIDLSGGTLTKQGDNFFAIGSGGAAVVNQTGGTLNSNNTFVGEVSTAVVNLDGGVANFTGQMFVGLAANSAGTLNIRNNAVVTSTEMIIGERDAASGTVNLLGGTLTLPNVRGVNASGPKTFNFGGGTLVAAADSANFIAGLTAANVQAGGAKIDTNGRVITVGQALVHDPALGGTPDGGLAVTGTGSLILAGGNTYTGPTAVSGGATLTVAATGAVNTSTLTSTTAVTNDGAVGVTAGGSVARIAGTGSLTLGGGSFAVARQPTLMTANSVGSLTLAGGAAPAAALDVANNKLTIASADPAVIRSQLVAGRNGGAWNGAAGIFSSTAQTVARRGVGYVGTVAGQPVTVSYAALGDTDLNQRVNLSDYNTLKANYSAFSTGKSWQQGDFDYDGKVALTDYNALKANYNAFGTYSDPAPSASSASLATFSVAAAAAAAPGMLELVIDKVTGEVRLVANAGESITIDGFTIYEDQNAHVWRPQNLDLSGLPSLTDAGSAAEGIAVIGGVTGGAPVGSGGVSIGSVFDTVGGAGLAASSIYWEYSVVGGGVVQDAAVTFANAVPEPAAFALVGIGGLGLLRRRRRAA